MPIWPQRPKPRSIPLSGAAIGAMGSAAGDQKSVSGTDRKRSERAIFIVARLPGQPLGFVKLLVF